MNSHEEQWLVDRLVERSAASGRMHKALDDAIASGERFHLELHYHRKDEFRHLGQTPDETIIWMPSGPSQ